MARKAKAKKQPNGNGATLGFEAKLWQAADQLHNNLDAAEYKHVVLGLIFLKYISDAFEDHRAKLAADKKSGADPEDPDEYGAFNIFWVPKAARWPHLQANGKQPTIGKLIDDAMVAIERDNKGPKGVLPKDYARPALDKQRLGELIDLVGTIGLGDKENRSKDILEGGRRARVLLVQHRDIDDPETGGAYTVKRYESDKESDGSGSWRHTEIRLLPVNSGFAPIIPRDVRDDEFHVVAEVVEVLGAG